MYDPHLTTEAIALAASSGLGGVLIGGLLRRPCPSEARKEISPVAATASSPVADKPKKIDAAQLALHFIRGLEDGGRDKEGEYWPDRRRRMLRLDHGYWFSLHPSDEDRMYVAGYDYGLKQRESHPILISDEAFQALADQRDSRRRAMTAMRSEDL